MQVVVVGGGFGGVKAALELSKSKKVSVTLISDRPDFQYYPALFSTATGGSTLQSWVALGEIFAHRHNVHVIVDRATTINKAKKTITTASGTEYPYQKLVLALGSVTTYFGIEGLDQYAFGIKSYDEIMQLKQHLLHGFAQTGNVDTRYLVIGAGPTGVELASALGDYLQHLKKKYQRKGKISVSLIEAAPRVLPRMSEAASAKVTQRLKKLGVKVEVNKKVEAETADSLIVNGRPIKSHTVIWTSGVATNPFYTENESQFEFSPNHKVVVDAHLRSSKDVYVIGDNAFTPYSGLAQTALHDGIYVAKHILQRHKAAYKPKQPPVVVPVGEGWAIFEYKWIRFGGFLGALMRRAADFMGYRDILPLGQALGVWHTTTVREEAVYYAELDRPRSQE